MLLGVLLNWLPIAESLTEADYSWKVVFSYRIYRAVGLIENYLE
jgi:hypothetical protein